MSNLVAQFKSRIMFLFGLYLLPLISLIVVLVIHLQTGIALEKFMRDPAIIADIRPVFGIISNFGVLVWCATATICFYTWSVSRKWAEKERYPNFLFFSGILTIILLVDDLFLLHEKFGGRGFSEAYTYGCYVLLTIVIFISYQKYIFKTEYIVLMIALILFGASLFIDIFQDYFKQMIGYWAIYIEDGFKFLGIVGWFGYYLRICFVEINKLCRLGKTEVV